MIKIKGSVSTSSGNYFDYEIEGLTPSEIAENLKELVKQINAIKEVQK
ncbi:MAG: hypothetical protein WC639_04705 [Patescibacteria group bacterium]|jgi:uncharacterized protein with ATP-grasp and redox domains